MTDAIRTLPDAALLFGAFCTASVVASLVLLAVLWLLWVCGEATRANVLHDLNHPTHWDASERAAWEAADRLGFDEYLPREDRS